MSKQLHIGKWDVLGKEALIARLEERKATSRHELTPTQWKSNNKALHRLQMRIDNFDEHFARLEREKPILLAHARGTIMDIDPLGGRFNDDRNLTRVKQEHKSHLKKYLMIDDLTSEKRRTLIAYFHRVFDLQFKLGAPKDMHDHDEIKKHRAHYARVLEMTRDDIYKEKEEEEMKVLGVLIETQHSQAVELHTLSTAVFALQSTQHEVLSEDIAQDDETLMLRAAVVESQSLNPGTLGKPCSRTMTDWYELYLIKIHERQAQLCRDCTQLISGESVQLLAERYENEAELFSSKHENVRRRHRNKRKIGAETTDSFLFRYCNAAKSSSIVPSLMSIANSASFEGELSPIKLSGMGL